jgi:hypothetical protein
MSGELRYTDMNLTLNIILIFNPNPNIDRKHNIKLNLNTALDFYLTRTLKPLKQPGVASVVLPSPHLSISTVSCSVSFSRVRYVPLSSIVRVIHHLPS